MVESCPPVVLEFPVETPLLSVLAGVTGALALGVGVLRACYRRAGAGEALLIERGERTRVCFGGARVWPVLDRAEVLDVSVRKVVVERRGRQGLSCQDGIRVDIRATFLVKVERSEEAVLRVAREVGCERANRPEEIQALLEERFACALANAASTFNFDELLADRSLFIDHVMMEAGGELLGFKLERMSLGRLEQTPLDQLDPTNLQDARGIQKLTERGLKLTAEVGSQARSSGPWVEPHEALHTEEDLAREVERAIAASRRKN